MIQQDQVLIQTIKSAHWIPFKPSNMLGLFLTLKGRVWTDERGALAVKHAKQQSI